jgi:hypothetical protein
LIRAIYDMAQARRNSQVHRGQLGVSVNSKHSWPIGVDRYTDFKTYSHAAARHGYVILGTDNVLQNGYEWIRSTGKLEQACGGESQRVISRSLWTSSR